MMVNTIPLHDWLNRIDSEYLSTFIKDGGASVKFAVTPKELKPELDEAIRSRCQELGYIVVKLDAAASRVYMPQDIFFGMAQQVNWRHLARQRILGLAKEMGYQADGIDPGHAGNVFEAIGAINGRDADGAIIGLESEFVQSRLELPIQDKVFKNPHMAKDFRVAMTHLCLRESTRENGQYDGQPLIDWLTGANESLSNVKPFHIHTKINRTTARYFIESALYWFQYVGHAGTVILLDNSRVTLARDPKDGHRYYKKAMTIDHYELLREFVDSTDQLAGALLVIVTNNEFLDEDPGSRGFGIYPALMTRVMDDIRDKTLVNPIASLVRVS
jgi:hypothetical protein